MRVSLCCLGLVLISACTDIGPPRFEQSMTLGGVEVSAKRLNEGRRAYSFYCMSCHGPNGDGMGGLGAQQRPRARDFRRGLIKFASVPAGSLPTDADLARVIRRGLKGTAMLAWDVEDDELDAVVQYIKTFSPRWRRERAGTPIVMSPDPWRNRVAEAADRGRELYHAQMQCISCHPAYATADEIRAWRRDAGLPGELRAHLDQPKQSMSVYGPLHATDFSEGPLRAGDGPEDLYRTVAAGVGGTAMPTWKGQVSEEDLWAVVHYLQALLSRS